MEDYLDFYFSQLPTDFPIDDINTILERLNNRNNLITGFIPPQVGFLNFEAFAYARLFENIEFTILADLNVVTDLEKIAKQKHYLKRNEIEIVAEIMAVAQAFDIIIDPSIAYHEFASLNGNKRAIEALSWFRLADSNRLNEWVDIAMGRKTNLSNMELVPEVYQDLEKPLMRWRKNYILALKISEIELKNLSPSVKVKHFVDWVLEYFFVAGPAIIFSSLYFSPNYQKSDMVKWLRSPNRDKAIKGIKNAAWDITQVSILVEKVNDKRYPQKRYIFASSDKKLIELSSLVLSYKSDLNGLKYELETKISSFWNGNDSNIIAKIICDAITVANSREAPNNTFGHEDYIGHLIEQGEKLILDWGV